MNFLKVEKDFLMLLDAFIWKIDLGVFFHQVCFSEVQLLSFLKSQMGLFFQFCLKKGRIILLHQIKLPIKPLAEAATGGVL